MKKSTLLMLAAGAVLLFGKQLGIKIPGLGELGEVDAATLLRWNQELIQAKLNGDLHAIARLESWIAAAAPAQQYTLDQTGQGVPVPPPYYSNLTVAPQGAGPIYKSHIEDRIREAKAQIKALKARQKSLKKLPAANREPDFSMLSNDVRLLTQRISALKRQKRTAL